MCKLVILADELVDLRLNQAVLIIKHANVVFESFCLSKQVQVIVVSSEIQASLLFNFRFKIRYDLLLLVNCIGQSCVVVGDLPRLLLDNEPLVL